MSTDIEFQSIAFTFSVNDLTAATRAILKDHFGCCEADYNAPGYLLLTQHGNNRSFDSAGRLARNWTLFSSGDHEAVMRDVLDAAKSVERETLRFHNSAVTLPHNYVKRQYEVLREALPLSIANESGLIQSIALHKSWGEQPAGNTVREAFPKVMASLADTPFAKLAEYLVDAGMITLTKSPLTSEIRLALGGSGLHAELARAFLLMYIVIRNRKSLGIGTPNLTGDSKTRFDCYGSRNVLSVLSAKPRAA